MRLHDYLDYWAREQPDAEFAVQGSRSLTYREALGAVNRLANAFVDSGLQIGDRVAILAKNSIEYVLWYYAASKAGVVAVPLNYRLAPPEWVYIINDAQAKALVAAGEYVAAIDGLRSELKTVDRLVALDGAGGAGWTEYRQWVSAQPSTAPERVVAEDDDVNQLYTSGTTGHPKGALLPHRTLTANIVQISLAVRG